MKNAIDLDRCILDMKGGGDIRDFLTLRDCFENVLITGSTGSGKTSSSGAALALSLLNKKGLKPSEKVGIIVFLYKAGDVEDWQRWAWLQGREDDLIHIKATDCDVLNLLECYANQEPINAVNCLMNLSGLSVNGSRKESEAFWETQQRTRLDRLIRLAQLSGEPLSITTLNRLHVSTPNDAEQLTSEEFANHSYCWQAMAQAAERVGEEHPDFKLVEDYFFREMPTLNDRTQSSILAMTSSVLQPFVSSTVLRNLFCGSSTLKLEEVFSGKILLLDIPIQTYRSVGRISQLLIGHVLMEEVEKRDLAMHGNPTIFWQDEFSNFITPFTSQFASTCRSSYTGSVWLTQNLLTLKAALGADQSSQAKVGALLGLANTRIAHANNCFETNRFYADSIGKSFISLNSVSVSRRNESSSSSSQALHYLVEPRNFCLLRKGGLNHQFMVDAIITGTGRVFSNGFNVIKTTFKQHFAM